MKRTPGYPCAGCGADYCPVILRIWLDAFARGHVKRTGREYRSFLEEYENWQLEVNDGPR